MHSTQLHLGKRKHRPSRRTADRSSSSPAAFPHSVGQQLRLALGESYSIAWLADQLKCSIECAKTLDGYWVVPNAHSRVHALTVFARVLHLDLELLQEVFAKADRAMEVRGAVRTAPKPLESRPASQPTKRLVTIGSNEGTREVRQSQPKIVWRRPRHLS